MKPVFVSDAGGRLYQTGVRQLLRMPETKREFLTRDIVTFLALSQHVVPDFFPQYHLHFGDNKQWSGPTPQLADHIEAAAGWLKGGSDIMVYCYYGRNRSGLVAALIIRELLGCTGAEALARLRVLRKGAVGGNPHFVAYLEELPAP